MLAAARLKARPPFAVSTKASRLRRVSRAFLWMSIRSVLGNCIARHNQLLWFRSNGQRLERAQVPHPHLAFFARLGWDFPKDRCSTTTRKTCRLERTRLHSLLKTPAIAAL